MIPAAMTQMMEATTHRRKSLWLSA
jgi:hypothetical protein